MHPTIKNRTLDSLGMKVLDSIQRWLLVCIATLLPLIFLPVTAEYFLTQKAYLVLFGSLIAVLIYAARIVATKKIHSVFTPFTRLLVALLIIYSVSLLFASPNPIQSLYALPGGLIVIGGFILFYLITTCASGVQRTEIPVMQGYVYGVIAAAAIIIAFYFKPLAGMSLSPELSFLKDQFSPIGNGLESLIVIGFAAVVAAAQILMSLKTGKHKASVLHMTMLGLTIIAGIMIGLIVFKPTDPTQMLKLPPLSISWYAGLETLKNVKTAFIGVGIDNFDTLFTAIKPVTYNLTPLWNVNFSLARSALLHIWVETGLLGLIAMLLLAVYIVRELHGLMTQNDKELPLYILAGIYVGAILLVLPPSFGSYSILFVYLAALAQKSMQYAKEPVEEFHLNKLPVLWLGIPLIMLMLTGVIAYYAGNVYAAEIHFKRSIDALRINDGKSVYENLQKAVQMNPRNERYRAQFAQLNLLLANNIARKAQQDQATDPKAGDKPDNKENQLSQQDRQAIGQFVQQAISEGKALVALNPARASHWNTLAVIYRNIINVAEGAQAWTIAAYQEAIRRDPNNPQLYLNLGGVYYGQGDYESATTHFQRAVALKPNWANAHYNLAWAHYQNGKHQESVAVMKNVLLLIDKKSKDYKAAQDNLKVFEEKAAEATDESKIKPVEPVTKPDTQPLSLPATPEAVLSPALKLPQDSGPEDQIEAAPSPASEGAEAGTPTPTPGGN